MTACECGKLMSSMFANLVAAQDMVSRSGPMTRREYVVELLRTVHDQIEEVQGACRPLSEIGDYEDYSYLMSNIEFLIDKLLEGELRGMAGKLRQFSLELAKGFEDCTPLV